MFNRYNLFIFDLDGTLIDSEKLHWYAYNEAFQKHNIQTITLERYFEIAHSETDSIKKYVEKNSASYDLVFQYKENIFRNLVERDLEEIAGANMFITNLIEHGKDIVVVTNSSRNRVDAVRNKLPFLKKISRWVYRDDLLKPKPSSEGYVRAISMFNTSLDQVLIFEDSLKGWISLRDIPVDTVLINTSDYIEKFGIQSTYHVMNYNDIENLQICSKNKISGLQNKLKIYQNTIECLGSSLIKNVCLLSTVLKETAKNRCGHLFITGIGKSGLIAKKSVSTWLSMGIRITFLHVEDMLHGEFGALVDGDTLIMLSNSGNSTELISLSKHLRKNFQVTQILITNNQHCVLRNMVEFLFVIGESKIREIDAINMAPTTSSVIFMMLLDMLAVNLAESMGITIEQFKKCHPGGDLGITKPLDYVVIVAAGLGTRLRPITDYIPKLLVNVDNDSVLKKIVDYWKKYTDRFVVIVDPIYSDIIHYYISQLDIRCTVETIDATGYENSYTINNVLKEPYHHKRLLLTWCDIFPSSEIESDVFGEKNIIFTYGNSCRYYADHNTIVRKDGGNVIGIYYFSDYCGLPHYDPHTDLIDLYKENFGQFKTVPIDSVEDIGDLPKLVAFTEKKYNPYITRFFNEIVDIGDMKLTKRAIHPKGQDIIEREMGFYKIVDMFDFFPQVSEYGRDYFVMSRLNAQPLYQTFSTFSIEKQRSIIQKVLRSLKHMHSIEKEVTQETIQMDVRIECLDKLRERLDDIKPVINYFHQIHSVNGIPINCKIEDVLEETYQDIVKEIGDRTKYTIIHGDCQFSNTLYDESEDKIYLIDPRGYFGKTRIYGLPEYDYAKVCYALSGYDQFNNNPLYNFVIENGDIRPGINNRLDEFQDLFTDPSTDSIRLLRRLLVVIWLGLAQYNKNNVLKCIAAYYNGLYLHMTIDS